MKKVIYVLISTLVVVSGIVLANRGARKETSRKSTPSPRAADEMRAVKEKWEATPEGINFNKWKTSAEGKKVLAAAARIRSRVSDSSNMAAVVTSLALPPGARLGFGVMVRINGDDYIVSFNQVKSNELQQLYRLKVDDKIILRGHAVSYAPKYSYPIISGDYVQRDTEIIYKAAARKGGC